MKKIIIIIILITFVSACSYKKDAEPNDIETEQEQLFNMKMKCAQIKDEIEGEIEEYNSNVTLKRACDESWQGTSVCANSLMHRELQEVFYSTKLNSCLSLEINTTFFEGENPNKWEEQPGDTATFNDKNFYVNDQYYILNDTLTGAELESRMAKWRNTPRELLRADKESPLDKYPSSVVEMLEEYK